MKSGENMKKIFLFVVILLIGCTNQLGTYQIQTAVAQTEIAKAEILQTENAFSIHRGIVLTQTAMAYDASRQASTSKTVIPSNRSQNQVWRLPLMNDATFWQDDKIFIDDDLEWVKITARNLAIPSPYYWEWIGLPVIRYADALKYYRGIIEPKGYKMVQSEQGFNAYGYSNTYIIEFTKYISSSKTSKIVIEFWEKTSDYDAQVLIFYVNPVD
jgi:hypothetical protein